MLSDKEADKLLKQFADAANKDILHPRDRQRFHQFVIDCYIWGRKVAEVDVRDRLEQLGFTHEKATDLASSYVHARDLLTEYDKMKGAKS